MAMIFTQDDDFGDDDGEYEDDDEDDDDEDFDPANPNVRKPRPALKYQNSRNNTRQLSPHRASSRDRYSRYHHYR